MKNQRGVIKMRHAILIIAHKNLDQLIRLLSVLQDDDFDIYIHLDKKWKVSDGDIKKIINTGENIAVLETRYSGYLDTWSLCKITLELVKEALNGKKNYSYFLLLSGQDYPIKPISYIKNTLETFYPKPLIDVTPMAKDNWIYSGFKWIRFHPYYRLVEKVTDVKAIRKLMLMPAYGIQFIITFLLKSPYQRLKNENCSLYGGSAWWILPVEIINLCLEEYEKNSKIVRAFKMKNTPEETFFQTMTMRSRLKDQVNVNDPYEILQNCMTYAYFFDDEHEPTGHPYILTESNYEMLKQRKEFFARKFDITIDDKILDLIEQNMLSEGT